MIRCLIKRMYWKTVAEHTPSSAKVMPIWICDNDKKIDLVYLTDDEKYFVSTDHKRVYLVDDVMWKMVDVPLSSEASTNICPVCGNGMTFKWRKEK